jgi:hypothetical protein
MEDQMIRALIVLLFIASPALADTPDKACKTGVKWELCS